MEQMLEKIQPYKSYNLWSRYLSPTAVGAIFVTYQTWYEEDLLTAEYNFRLKQSNEILFGLIKKMIIGCGLTLTTLKQPKRGKGYQVATKLGKQLEDAYRQKTNYSYCDKQYVERRWSDYLEERKKAFQDMKEDKEKKCLAAFHRHVKTHPDLTPEEIGNLYIKSRNLNEI